MRIMILLHFIPSHYFFLFIATAQRNPNFTACLSENPSSQRTLEQVGQSLGPQGHGAFGLVVGDGEVLHAQLLCHFGLSAVVDQRTAEKLRTQTNRASHVRVQLSAPAAQRGRHGTKAVTGRAAVEEEVCSTLNVDHTASTIYSPEEKCTFSEDINAFI